MPDSEYVVTREQVMALVNPPSVNQEKVRERLLVSIFGRCESTWKDLRCIRYDGHHSYHSSGEVDGGAWASWERSEVLQYDGEA